MVRGLLPHESFVFHSPGCMKVDVNLLEGLDDALSLHLPTSRLPLPVIVAPSAASSARLPSSPPLSQQTRSVSLTLSQTGGPIIGDAPSQPTSRRAFRRVVNVREAVGVQMTSVQCPLTRKIVSSNGGAEGLALCIEIIGTGEEGRETGFLIERIRVKGSGGAGHGDLEVRRIGIESLNGKVDRVNEWPMVLKARDQHNFLYEVGVSRSVDDDAYSTNRDHTTSSSIRASSTPAFNGAGRRIISGRPLVMRAGSSTRFGANIVAASDTDDELPGPIRGDAEEIETEDERDSPASSIYSRTIQVTITGRPIRLTGLESMEGFESLTASFDAVHSFPIDVKNLIQQRGATKFTMLPNHSMVSTTGSNLSRTPQHQYQHQYRQEQRLQEPRQNPSNRSLPSLPSPSINGQPGSARRFVSSAHENGTTDKNISREGLKRSGRERTEDRDSVGSLSRLDHTKGEKQGDHVIQRGQDEVGDIIISVGLVSTRSPSPLSSSSSPSKISTAVPEEDDDSDRSEGIRIKLLDVFMVEVFVLNRGNEVKRFTIGLPSSQSNQSESDDRVANIVALDQDIRIGYAISLLCVCILLIARGLVGESSIVHSHQVHVNQFD